MKVKNCDCKLHSLNQFLDTVEMFWSWLRWTPRAQQGFFFILMMMAKMILFSARWKFLAKIQTFFIWRKIQIFFFCESGLFSEIKGSKIWNKTNCEKRTKSLMTKKWSKNGSKTGQKRVINGPKMIKNGQKLLQKWSENGSKLW